MDAEARFFKALSDPTRLRLATILAIEGETCVCQLAEALDVPEYKISRHLGILRNSGMVEARREGTWMYYKLTDARNKLEKCLQGCLQECFTEHSTVVADQERLSGTSCRN